MDTPYQWTKQVASHFGGTRNGTIVHWPKGIRAKGEIRPQFHHVIDVAPTVLELAGLPEPLSVHGVQQRAIEGVSMAYSFNDANAADRHETQYFEMIGNRGIYHKGWTAVTKHRTPWETRDAKAVAFDDDVWELYDTNRDWTQARDVAAQHPDVLQDLQRLWMIEAVKYNVLPLDDRMIERGDPAVAGRPELAQGKRQILYKGMGRLPEAALVNLHNTSHSITAEVDVANDGAEGVIAAVGGITGGWSLYVKDGKPKYCYNFFGLSQYFVEGDTPLPAGKHQVRVEFAYDGGGIAKGGNVTLFVDGTPAGTGRVDRTEPMIFSADESCDVGFEAGSPVTSDYGQNGDTRFNGTVNWVELDTSFSNDDHSHLISPKQRFRSAMAVQ